MKRVSMWTMMVLLLSSLSVNAVQPAPTPDNVAKAPANALKFAEGLHYIVIKPGNDKFANKQYIKSLTTAWTSVDGQTQFNAAEDGVDVSDPASLAEMVPGFAKALKATPIGEKRRWWVAANLMAPGWKGFIPGDYTIDIEVLAELDPLPAPANVAAAPKAATVTASGLAYQVLKHGNNSAKPQATSTVLVHYSGWTTDGKMFDSSVLRDKPIEFPLNRVIKGWTEGLQLMSPGDQYRFWIPNALAYGAKPRAGAPKGDLVFDVELFEIKPEE